MNSIVKRAVEGGVRVGVDLEGFGAGTSKPKRPDLGVLTDHRLQG
jgi:hypothetical protein